MQTPKDTSIDIIRFRQSVISTMGGEHMADLRRVVSISDAAPTPRERKRSFVFGEPEQIDRARFEPNGRILAWEPVGRLAFFDFLGDQERVDDIAVALTETTDATRLYAAHFGFVIGRIAWTFRDDEPSA